MLIKKEGIKREIISSFPLDRGKLPGILKLNLDSINSPLKMWCCK
jgi:hypothetical protein